VIAPERVESFLTGLPVEALWGVGKVTAGRLHAIGVTRLVDIRTLPDETLRQAVGSWADGLRALAFGQDERPVVPDRPTKSCGAERTFDQDLTDPARMEAEIRSLSARVAVWLEKKGLYARTVTLKVRYSDFTTVTRCDSEVAGIRAAEEIAVRALALLSRTEVASRPVRLLGVSTHGLSTTPAEHSRTGEQLSLFENLPPG
jgi:DNA polymerase-4